MVTAYNTSSSSILVSWEPVPTGYLHGRLQGYKVLYEVSSASNSTWLEKRIDAKTSSVAIFNLTKFTKYNVQVLAFTVVGDGKPSKAIQVTTDEDGKNSY